jgi:hypothetical protein
MGRQRLENGSTGFDGRANLVAAMRGKLSQTTIERDFPGLEITVSLNISSGPQ